MNIDELEITNGFVGSCGTRYHRPESDELESAIQRAMKFNSKTREEIEKMIDDGQSVKWRKSPNFYYDHSYGIIVKKKIQPKIEMIRCDCGHSVPRGSVMNSSAGTSCPDCYDRMSM